MLNTIQNKASWLLFAILALLMLASTPLIVPAVHAGDCPNAGTSC